MGDSDKVIEPYKVSSKLIGTNLKVSFEWFNQKQFLFSYNDSGC